MEPPTPPDASLALLTTALQESDPRAEPIQELTATLQARFTVGSIPHLGWGIPSIAE